jgi:hypothetical protein
MSLSLPFTLLECVICGACRMRPDRRRGVPTGAQLHPGDFTLVSMDLASTKRELGATRPLRAGAGKSRAATKIQWTPQRHAPS